MLIPKIGESFYLYIENIEDNQEIEYKTRLVDTNETEYFLDAPINVQTNESSYIANGKQLRVEYVNSQGLRNIFKSVIVRHLKKNIPLMVIPKPDENEITQVQRRNFFRIEIDVDLAVQKSNQTRKVFTTEDIGGGGISFVAGPSDNFLVDEKLDCWILLPYKAGNIDHAHFKASVIRVKEERGHKIVMLSYREILESERQRIIRYSFAKQIELKDKGIN